MAKKFRVIPGSTPSDPSSIPSSLGANGRSLWSQVQAEYDVSDIGGRELLFQACSAADRAANCAAIIDKEGELVRSGNSWRDHPLIRMELSARSFVVRTLMRLGITTEAVKSPGRPGAPRGWQPPAGYRDDDDGDDAA